MNGEVRRYTIGRTANYDIVFLKKGPASVERRLRVYSTNGFRRRTSPRRGARRRSAAYRTQQKGRIIRLRAAGVDTWHAERALRLFEEHRDILKTRK
jgi:hypothetical protein